MSNEEMLNLFTLLLALFTLGLVLIGYFTARIALKEQKKRNKDYETTTRPYIYIYAKPYAEDPNFIYLYIEHNW